jgi:outer membrane protein
MRKSVFILGMLFLLIAPATSHAMGVELAVGGWSQNPQGDLSFEEITSDDILDLEKDLNYDRETRIMGRLKIDMPLLIPNIYLMATPMEFEGTGKKSVDFNFGDVIFQGDVDFESKLTLHHIDIALYYGLPFIKKATLDTFNIDVGLNVRVLYLKAQIAQQATGLKESESFTFPIPMAYIAAQLRPIDRVAVEAEARGIAYGDDHIYSLIGRLKIKLFGPLFGAVGYRYDTINIDKEDIDVDIEFRGPFGEVGFQF